MMDYAGCGEDSGDAEIPLREQLFNEHLYLCRRGARKFCRASDDRADLEQTAAVGLIKAADRFEKERGTPFEAFAWIFIEGELSHYVRDWERLVRPPRRLRALDRRWRDRQATLCAELGRQPTEGELASDLRLDGQTRRELFEYRERTHVESIEDLSDVAAAGSYTMDAEDDRLVIECAMRSLTELERLIVTATMERDASASQIAGWLGYSERHVSRVRRQAIEKLAALCVFSGHGGH